MTRLKTWFAAAALTGILAAPASAQFGAAGTNPYFRGTPGSAPGLLGGAVGALQVNPYGANPYVAGAANPNPYGGGPGYYGGFGIGIPDVYGGYLRGAADVVNAQGQFLIAKQQSQYMREKWLQERVETRRKVFDEWLYEREKKPTLEQIRQEGQREDLKRALNNPPVSEIASARSLNTLLAASIPVVARGGNLPNVPVDEELLKRVNVSRDGSGAAGGIGLLRDEGKLTWPLGLRDLPPAEQTGEIRKTIDSLAREVYNQAMAGKVDSGILKEIAQNIRKLDTRLTAAVNQMDYNQYSAAKNFLRNLDGAIVAMQQNDPGEYLNSKGAVKGKTVAEVVRSMAERGLKFAPAVAGDERAYNALHTAMVNFYNATQTQITANP